ncbi:non-ribosomal peptide synthetase [Pleionea sp. CnH1-48]|uniref:non-ribosomal peptide synthetase n=1 Tax=Pleionea sp. CnH1-48 TaxID=2954494 RepID=UPI002097D862|nr:non-ribosomal peptide synthetase [Pleionea sp. CnH1-48]MCO7224349.1 amino acid adenylation domain-containing protein [Pleionea sp. CnH1-48]
MTQQGAFNREEARKELLRYLLQQVKEKQLPKNEAVNFLKLLDDKEADKTDEAIAIVGIACRFPEADNKETFWQNLCEKRNSIREFPEARHQELTAVTDEELPLFRGGFLEKVDEFDAEFFGIAPQVAQHMDPYHRMMLEVLVESIEDAGYQHSELYGKQVGVFVGNDHAHRMVNNYLDFIDMSQRDFNSMTGSWSALLAGRLSYSLNLRGPAQVVDTSCSSGLVALDAAIKALSNKDCDSALVGAINLMFLPIKNVVGEVENQDSQVCAFDQRASGTVWGEGVASIMIKPLPKAKQDGDTIYGLIKGMAVNSDGASNGITAPSSRAQQEVLLKSWQRAGINPEHISYVEAHGTGTHLGDPIELKGLSGAFAKSTDKKQFCGLGSVKTNIGHTVGVSGLASLIKVLMSFKHQQLAPSVNFDTPNQFIDFCNSPVFYNDTLRPWDVPAPRIAGVSSFGLSGTNCHLVLQEYTNNDKAESLEHKDELFAIPVSARNSDLLVETLQRYLDFLTREPDTQLEDVCYTAAMGRAHHSERVMILARSVSELVDRLQNVIISLRSRVSSKAPVGVYLPSAEKSSTKQSELGRQASELLKASQWPSEDVFAQLAKLYVAGAQIKWSALFEGGDYRRLHLPAQPFVKQRFWFEDKNRAKRTANKLTLRDLTEEADNADPRDMYRVARVADSIKENSHPWQGELAIGAQVVAYVVCDTLGYETIKLTDNYYALGGDSISGTRIVYILNEMLGLKAELSDILATDNLECFIESLVQHRELATAITRLESEEGEEGGNTNSSVEASPTSISKISAVAKAEYYPLSRAQRRMYMQSELDPDATTYNATAMIELAQAPVMEEEQEVLQHLVERHESLRTRFEMVEGVPVQKVSEQPKFEPYYLDASERKGSIESILQELVDEYVRPFDLTVAPLLRVVFAKIEQRYFMLIDMHHIITDGASVGIFIQEYMALKKGHSLPPLSISYKDFAASDIAQVTTEKYQRQAKHWLKRFEDNLPVAQLDTDYPRPVSRDFRGATLHTQIGSEQLQSLQRLAVAQGCSLFVLLMSAFRVLLAKYGAGNDLTIGTPVSGRNHHQTHGLIGMFVNTLALRDRVDNNESFVELLAHVKSRTLEDFDHQDYAYEDLIEALGQTHIPDRNPLFDICLVLQNQDMGLSTDGALQDVPFEAGIAKFDLTVFCRENANTLEINWEYATALFGIERIKQMAEHFKQLLDCIVTAPEQKITDIDFYNENDRERLLTQDIKSSNPAFSFSLGELFASQVEYQKDAIAVIHGEESLSYKELHQRSNQLAHYLIAQGVQPGDPVALWFAPSLDMLVAIFAVLKTGAAYVPLDVANPIERTQGILEDCQAQSLLTHANLELPDSLSQRITPLSQRVISLDQIDLKDYPTTDTEQKVTSEEVAYIMYTSGTTGKPKGTLIRHKSIIRVVKNTNYLHLDSSDVCLMLSNYAFDGCVPDLYGALLNGGRLILADKDNVLDTAKIAELVTQHQVTSMFVTTALFNLLVDQQLEQLESIKNLMFGGEMVSFEHVSRAFQRLGEGRLIHCYGPTETTVFATTQVIKSLRTDMQNVPIGLPLNQTSAYILDEERNPVPFGCTGELYIGGDGLALGYLNRDELTAERFVDNPFCAGEKLYRSGDLVRRLNDNNILYVGRIDKQVKIRGFRIELGEIENVLVTLPQLSQAVVVDFKQDNKKYLAAYVVPQADADFDVKEIRKQLAKTLPNYMIPDCFVMLDSFPLTINNKVDHRRLPLPELTSEEEYVGPSNPLETELCEVWQRLLKRERVGIEDNFFSIGGDSIIGIQLVSRLRQAGYSLQVKDIFAAPTVAQLASWLSHNKSQVDYEAEQGVLTGAFALTASQQAMVQASKETIDCHTIMMSVGEELDEGTLSRALKALALQHDMLRCYFDLENNQQVYSDDLEHLPSIKSLDISQFTDKTNRNELQESLQLWKSDIELNQAPIWRLGVLSGYQKGKKQLCFILPHLIADETSSQLIAKDLQALLKGEPLDAKTSSYRQWSEALSDSSSQSSSQSQESYWEQVRSQPRPEIQLADHRERRSVEKAFSAKSLSDANEGYRTDAKELLLSALALSLHQSFGNKLNTIVLGEQERPTRFESLNFSRTLGSFVRHYPVVLHARQTIGDTIIQSKEMIRGVPKQGVGFESSEQSASFLSENQPLVCMNYRKTNNEESLEDLITLSDENSHASGFEPRDKVGLFIDCVLDEKLLTVSFESLLTQEQTEAFTQAFEQALNQVINQGQVSAEQGGEATPSDFGVESLSLARLQKIQGKLSAKDSDKSKAKKPAKKNKMKV